MPSALAFDAPAAFTGRNIGGGGDDMARIRSAHEVRLGGAELDDVVFVRADEDREIAFLDFRSERN